MAMCCECVTNVGNNVCVFASSVHSSKVKLLHRQWNYFIDKWNYFIDSEITSNYLKLAKRRHLRDKYVEWFVICNRFSLFSIQLKGKEEKIYIYRDR